MEFKYKDVKMKKMLVGALLLGMSVTASARYSINGSIGGDINGYQGYSGSQYQYDLNDAYQRQQYNLDIDARMRDQYNSNDIGRYLDNSIGQYGGGSYGY